VRDGPASQLELMLIDRHDSKSKWIPARTVLAHPCVRSISTSVCVRGRNDGQKQTPITVVIAGLDPAIHFKVDVKVD